MNHPPRRIHNVPACVSVGLCTAEMDSYSVRCKQAGWDEESWGLHGDDGHLLVLPIEAVAPRSVWRQKTSRAPTSRELFRPKPAGTQAELPTAPSKACLLFVSGTGSGGEPTIT